MQSLRLLSEFFSEDEIFSLRTLTQNHSLGEDEVMILPENALRTFTNSSDPESSKLSLAYKLAHTFLSYQTPPNKVESLSFIASLGNLAPHIALSIYEYLRRKNRV